MWLMGRTEGQPVGWNGEWAGDWRPRRLGTAVGPIPLGSSIVRISVGG